MPPLLLISVRDSLEASIAVRYGADIVDIKDPAQGSLGRAEMPRVDEIVRELADPTIETPVPLTMALGELAEVVNTRLAVPSGITGVKLGLAGCNSDSNWPQRWSELMTSINKCSPSALDWIAVIYADRELADAPSADEVVEVASDLNCRGVLVDTFTKSEFRIWDFLESMRLRELAESVHEREMFFALAGRLRISDLPQVSGLSVDVVALRSGVCIAGERMSRVDPLQVERFRAAMDATWGDNSRESPQRSRNGQSLTLPAAALPLNATGRGRG